MPAHLDTRQMQPKCNPRVLEHSGRRTMQLSIEEGSGPILYWTGWLCLFLCAARMRLTSPPISPGSTVIWLPSPCARRYNT